METKLDRRSMLKIGLGASGTALAALGLGMGSAKEAWARLCGITPRQPLGPFYPAEDPKEKDTDLTRIAGSTLSAVGTLVYLDGVVMDTDCRPVEGALVEIWQACHSGKYNHPGDVDNPAPLDPNFQYYGKALTDAEGRYSFRTIKPGSYPAGEGWVRPPHIHFKIQKRGFHELVTQLYFGGEALNDKDLLLQQLSAEEQKKVVVDFKTSEFEAGRILREKDSLSGNFDITLNKVTRN